MIEIIKDVLNKKQLLELKNFLESIEIVYFFFSHMFFRNHEILSNGFYLIKPILEKLKCKGLIHIRANLIVNIGKHYESSWHTDCNFEDFKTAIFYLNTCNGHTLFKDKKIESKENVLVNFTGKLLHKMVSQTDTKRRIVINFNYV